MINAGLILIIAMLSFLSSIVLFCLSFDKDCLNGSKVRYMSLLSLICGLLLVSGYGKLESTQEIEVREYDVVIIGKQACIEYQDNVLNINKKFHRNFEPGKIKIKVAKSYYPFYGLLYLPERLVKPE